jgi:hypothetical protein
MVGFTLPTVTTNVSHVFPVSSSVTQTVAV